MLTHREKLGVRARQFAIIIGQQSKGDIKRIWSFGSLPNGKKRPRDADIAIEIKPNARAREHFVALRDELAPKRRFGGVSIHAVPVTSSELESERTEIAQAVRKHNLLLWSSDAISTFIFYFIIIHISPILLRY